MRVTLERVTLDFELTAERCVFWWNYVRENPVRAGLVDSADEWPYGGEIVRIVRA